MVLDHTSSYYDLASFRCSKGYVVDFSNVLDKIYYKATVIEWVEIDDITYTAVCKSWAKDRDFIDSTPIVYTFLVINFKSHSSNYLTWREDSPFLCLLFMKLLDQGLKPTLEFNVIVIRHN